VRFRVDVFAVGNEAQEREIGRADRPIQAALTRGIRRCSVESSETRRRERRRAEGGAVDGRLLIARRYVTPRPLSQREAAWLLRDDARAVRNALRRGDLAPAWVGRRRLVDAVDLAARLAGDELALEALAGLLEGRICLPHPSQAAPSLPRAVAAAALGRPSLTRAVS
jgi:hypothetical protein